MFFLCVMFLVQVCHGIRKSRWKTIFLLETIIFKFRTTLCGLEFPAKVFMWEPPMFVLLVGAICTEQNKSGETNSNHIYIYIFYTLIHFIMTVTVEGLPMIHSWLRSLIILGITCESNDY